MVDGGILMSQPTNKGVHLGTNYEGTFDATIPGYNWAGWHESSRWLFFRTEAECQSFNDFVGNTAHPVLREEG